MTKWEKIERALERYAREVKRTVTLPTLPGQA